MGCERSKPSAGLVPLPFTVSGQVTPGKQLGTKLGFPTANLCYDMRPGLWPEDGVYAGVALARGSMYLCVLNQGRHPTAPGGAPTVEAHLLDYSDGPLYGEQITLEYLHYLRPEATFPSLDALREQLKQDQQNARSWAKAFPTLADGALRRERS